MSICYRYRIEVEILISTHHYFSALGSQCATRWGGAALKVHEMLSQREMKCRLMSNSSLLAETSQYERHVVSRLLLTIANNSA